MSISDAMLRLGHDKRRGGGSDNKKEITFKGNAMF